MGIFQSRKTTLPSRDDALPGRAQALRVPVRHFVNGNRIVPPFAPNLEEAIFGLGCFWGAERRFWQTEGVYSTAVGYAGGFTPTPPTRRSARAAPATRRSFRVVFDPRRSPLRGTPARVLGVPRPDAGDAPGEDVGTRTARSASPTSGAQLAAARTSKAGISGALRQAGHGLITTEIAPAPPRSTTPRNITSSTSRRVPSPVESQPAIPTGVGPGYRHT